MLRSLLASTASNGSRFAVTTIITLVMTPVYIRELGNYDYGIWEIMMSVVGYLGLLDMGLRPTISRFTAYLSRSDDPAEQSALFATSLCMMAAVGVLISMALLTWSMTFPGVLAPDSDSAGRYATLIQIFAVHVVLSFPYFSLESTYEGRLFYTTKNNISIGHSIISATFLYHYLPQFDPLLLLVTVNVVMTASKLVLLFAILHTSSYGEYRFHPGHFSPSMMFRMLRFGGKALAQGIAGQVSKRADPLIIGAFLGPQKIVFFNLGSMLLERVKDSTQIMGHAFMPAFSTLHSASDQKTMDKYFQTGTKYIYGLAAASCAGLAAIGDVFISLWIGPEYGAEVRPIIWILAATALVGGALPLHNRFLMALNSHGILAIIYSARAVINVVLTLLLVRPFGLVGVASATLIGQLVTAPFVWAAVFRHLAMSPTTYVRSTLLPILGSTMVMMTCVVVALQLFPMDGWYRLLGIVALGVVVYVPLFVFGVLDSDDRRNLSGAIRKVRKAL